jgi:hypothetical protein
MDIVKFVTYPSTLQEDLYHEIATISPEVRKGMTKTQFFASISEQTKTEIESQGYDFLGYIVKLYGAHEELSPVSETLYRRLSFCDDFKSVMFTYVCETIVRRNDVEKIALIEETIKDLIDDGCDWQYT